MIPKTTLAGLLASMRSGENDPLRNWRPSVVATTGQTATVNMTTADGSAYTVDWGDGTSSTVASAANATRVYAGNYSGAIRIFSTGIFTRVNSWTGTVTLTGTTAQLPTGLTILQLIGSSITLTGTTAQLPTGLTYLQLNGSSIAVTGTTAQLPTGLTYLYLSSNSITLTGSSTPWRTASMRHVYISAYGLATATDVDNLLIALSGVTSWVTEKLVDLRGAGNAARTAASNAAVSTIQSYGVTVLTN